MMNSSLNLKPQRTRNVSHIGTWKPLELVVAIERYGKKWIEESKNPDAKIFLEIATMRCHNVKVEKLAELFNIGKSAVVYRIGVVSNAMVAFEKKERFIFPNGIFIGNRYLDTMGQVIKLVWETPFPDQAAEYSPEKKSVRNRYNYIFGGRVEATGREVKFDFHGNPYGNSGCFPLVCGLDNR